MVDKIFTWLKDWLKKEKLELLVFSVILVLSIALTHSCATSADTQFLQTNLEASTLFGDKLVYYLEKYKESEKIDEEQLKWRIDSIKEWQAVCKKAYDSHVKGK